MSKSKKIMKWSAITLLSLIAAVIAFGFWFMSLIPSVSSTSELKHTVSLDLPYLVNNVPQPRGKILIVVTSAEVMGTSGKPTGYELTELSRAYYVFQANGFEVDVASPRGGEPPVIIDNEDMGPYDYAFLNDKVAQQKISQSIPIQDVSTTDYQAVYFAGGKGAMFDFPDNDHIQSLVSSYYHSDKVIGAVCHGPAALVNVKLKDGTHLLAGKTVSGFTNDEELFLIPNAAGIFPFLLQDKLEEKGAKFSNGTMYLKNVSTDGNLITGQNPWSTWRVAEAMIEQLGYEPKKRIKTPPENTIDVLVTYENLGYGSAKEAVSRLYLDENKEMDRVLLAMHSIVAAMQWKVGKSLGLIRLLKHTKNISEEVETRNS